MLLFSLGPKCCLKSSDILKYSVWDRYIKSRFVIQEEICIFTQNWALIAKLGDSYQKHLNLKAISAFISKLRVQRYVIFKFSEKWESHFN